jgi:hypothetical protein
MKQPNWRVPLVLAAVLAGSGSFAYWLQYSHKPKKEKSESATKKPMLVEENEQIVSFKLKGTHGLIEGRCDELAQKRCTIQAKGNWTMVYPVPVKGDAQTIHEFLGAISDSTAPETIDLSDETPEKRKALLKEYGLSEEERAKPESEYVEFNLEGGKKKAIWIGVDHPVGDKTFVAASDSGTINDKTIYLVSNYFKTNLDYNLTHFRDKTMFTFDPTKITAVNGKTSYNPLDLKKENGRWVVNGMPADDAKVEAMIASFPKAVAKDFPADDDIKGMKPSVTLDLHEGAEKTYTVTLYDRSIPIPGKKNKAGKDEIDHRYFLRTEVKGDGLLVAKASASPAASAAPSGTPNNIVDSKKGGLFEIDGLLPAQMNRKLNELRRHEVFSQTEKVTATRVRVEGPSFKNALNFEYEKGKWVQKFSTPTPDPKKDLVVDADKVAALLETLTNAKIYDFVSPKSVPVSMMNDQVRLSIGDEKNPEKFHFIFYISGQKPYAQNLNSASDKLSQKEAYLMDNIVQNALPFKVESWKKSNGK